MEDRLYYIDGSWVTYNHAHQLGFTQRPAIIHTFYDEDCTEISIKQDPDDHTYYDGTRPYGDRWVLDPALLGLYTRIGPCTLYMSEEPIQYIGYSAYLNSELTHVTVDNHLTPLYDLYSTRGITEYPCSTYCISEGIKIAWYDSRTNLYWDNRPNHMLWIADPSVFNPEHSQQAICGQIENGEIYFTGSLSCNTPPESGRIDNQNIIQTGSLLSNIVPTYGIIDPWFPTYSGGILTETSDHSFKSTIQDSQLLLDNVELSSYIIPQYGSQLVLDNVNLYGMLPSNGGMITLNNVYLNGFAPTLGSTFEANIPTQIEVILGLKYLNGQWTTRVFNYQNQADNYFWAGILNQRDYNQLSNMGLIDTSSSYPYKEVLYSDRYNYDVLELYSDLGSTVESVTLSDFYVAQAPTWNCIGIFCTSIYSQDMMAWKCRITRKDTIKYGYFFSDKQNGWITSPQGLNNLYDESGNLISYNPLRTYEFITADNSDSETASVIVAYNQGFENNNGILALRMNITPGYSGTGRRVKYRES